MILTTPPTKHFKEKRLQKIFNKVPDPAKQDGDDQADPGEEEEESDLEESSGDHQEEVLRADPDRHEQEEVPRSVRRD